MQAVDVDNKFSEMQAFPYGDRKRTTLSSWLNFDAPFSVNLCLNCRVFTRKRSDLPQLDRSLFNSEPAIPVLIGNPAKCKIRGNQKDNKLSMGLVRPSSNPESNFDTCEKLNG